MLSQIFLFFKKEPKYFWVFLAVAVIYGLIFISPAGNRPALSDSEEVLRFRAAEESWNQDMSREGALSDFMEREPALSLIFILMTVFFIAAFLIGGVLDVIGLWKPALFEKFRSDLSPPPTQAWSFSMLFKVVVLFMLMGVVISFLIGILSPWFPKRSAGNIFMLLHTLILNILCVYWMIVFVKRTGGDWRDLGLRVPGTGLLREILVGWVGYLKVLPLLVMVVVILLGLAGFLGYEPPDHPLVNIFIEEEKRAPFLVAFSVALGVVIGPAVEEIFFRGFCYPILRNRWGKIGGMILSAAFFAGIHHSGFVFWPVFILGIALAQLYENRRSLAASITLHITHNSLLIGYFFLAKQIIGR